LVVSADWNAWLDQIRPGPAANGRRWSRPAADRHVLPWAPPKAMRARGVDRAGTGASSTEGEPGAPGPRWTGSDAAGAGQRRPTPHHSKHPVPLPGPWPEPPPSTAFSPTRLARTLGRAEPCVGAGGMTGGIQESHPAVAVAATWLAAGARQCVIVRGVKRRGWVAHATPGPRPNRSEREMFLHRQVGARLQEPADRDVRGGAGLCLGLLKHCFCAEETRRGTLIPLPHPGRAPPGRPIAIGVPAANPRTRPRAGPGITSAPWRLAGMSRGGLRPCKPGDKNSAGARRKGMNVALRQLPAWFWMVRPRGQARSGEAAR